MTYSDKKTGVRLLLTLTAFSMLVACGGKNKDIEEKQHEHAHTDAVGGRLLYSTDVADTLKVYDQTLQPTPQFNTTTVATLAKVQLTLATDGLTVAMLEGADLSVVNSGLAHLHGEHAHSHPVSLSAAPAIANVQQVVATGEYFSILSTTGSSTLLNSDGTATDQQWPNVVYPTLALAGGDFLTFTQSGDDVDLTVVDAQGSSGTEGRIFLRPNDDGYLAQSISCAGGIRQAAQTENLTLIACEDGSLRWLISGYEAPDAHPQAGKTIHVTQRYPATVDVNNNEVRPAGAVGEVVAGSTKFIGDILNVLAASFEDNLIAAWSADQLWLISAHGDHPHQGDLSALMRTDFGNAIALAANSHDALAVLSDQGNVAITRYAIQNHKPQAIGAVTQVSWPLNGETFNSERAVLLSGDNAFFMLHPATASLFEFDAHSDEEDYHLHRKDTHSDLKSAQSAVFAYIKEQHDEHTEDHDASEHSH